MDKFTNAVSIINERLGEAFSYLIYPGIAILFFEVISRYVFNSPTIWAHGYSQRIFGTYFILIGAFTLLKGGHVRIDLLYNRFNKKVRTMLDILNYVFLLVWSLVLMRTGWDYFMYSFRISEVDEMVLGHPVYPVKFFLVIGAFLIFMQGLSMLIQKIVFLVRGDKIEHRSDNHSTNV